MSGLKECHRCGKPYYVHYNENGLNSYSLNCYKCRIGVRIAGNVVMSIQMVTENSYWASYKHNANKPMLSINYGFKTILITDSKIYSLDDIKELIECMDRKIS